MATKIKWDKADFFWNNNPYTWNEVVGQLYMATNEEIDSLRGIPYGKIRLNS